MVLVEDQVCLWSPALLCLSVPEIFSQLMSNNSGYEIITLLIKIKRREEVPATKLSRSHAEDHVLRNCCLWLHTGQLQQ